MRLRYSKREARDYRSEVFRMGGVGVSSVHLRATGGCAGGLAFRRFSHDEVDDFLLDPAG